MNVAIAIIAALVFVAVGIQVTYKLLRKPAKPKLVHRVCSNCDKPILRSHKFTGRSTSQVHHRNCNDPELKQVAV